jgi:soluble lytic murein transglycosylase
MRISPPIFAAALLAALLPAACRAQSDSSALARARVALEAAERGAPDRLPLPAEHPLAGWVEFAALRRNLDGLSAEAGQAFLNRYRGQPVAEAFREQWLGVLAGREDWPAFRAAWSSSVKSTALRCAELNARQALGATDADWTADAQALWRGTGRSLPGECDAPMSVLAVRGGLQPALRWERIEKAAAEWQPGVMRAAARGLPAEEFALANDYAAFVDAPHDRALGWPKTARSRLVASHGLARLAKANPASAEARLPRFAAALGMNDVERGRVLYQAALWTVASYGPESARRLAAVPDVAYDDKLHEWRVREALARSDWNAALAAIRKMGDTEPGRKMRRDSRWRYFEARLLEMAGDKANAAILYRDAATKPEFHGFLAADRIGAPYALCPWTLEVAAAERSAVARDPSMVRAMLLYRLERGGWAEREWNDALSRFTPEQRRIAVGIAQDNGWFDRGVFGLVNVGGKSFPEELRLYELRFPLHHDAVIRREAAKHRLDPTWVAAEIRAESVFNPKARSHADARGLMQVLPSTGAGIAKRLGLPWRGGDSLYEPEFNIQLGTAYLRELEDKYGLTYVAIAAYNAGPAPVARWQSQRPGMDADFWIETISYKETRDYVARILAFSVIYDWRLNGRAMPITDRLAGRMVDTRKAFVCPAPEAAPAGGPANPPARRSSR